MRNQFQIEMLQQHGDDKLHLNHCELIADALVRPAEKREVRAFWDGLAGLRQIAPDRICPARAKRLDAGE
jgi:hypothetical protein